MPHPALETALCRLTGVQYPIVQTGMGWVASAGLVAGTANAGGLGIIASATMDLPELADAIARTKDRTDRPFGVNLRSDAPDVMKRAELMVREGVKVASFALAPNEALMKELKQQGLVCIPSIGAKRHAEKVAAWGADALIVQGGEAGGHTGTVPTTVLLPQVVDAVDIPVIAAGGFFDGRGLVAALAYGAAGIAMGTRFLLTAESPVPKQTTDRYLAAGVFDVVVSQEIDGLPQRMVVNELVRELETKGPLGKLLFAVRNALAFRQASGASIPELLRSALALRSHERLTRSQLLMSANAPMLARRAMTEGDPTHGYLPSGTIAGAIDDRPTCDELVRRIVQEAERTLAALAV